MFWIASHKLLRKFERMCFADSNVPKSFFVPQILKSFPWHEKLMRRKSQTTEECNDRHAQQRTNLFEYKNLFPAKLN